MKVGDAPKCIGVLALVQQNACIFSSSILVLVPGRVNPLLEVSGVKGGADAPLDLCHCHHWL